MPKNFSNFFEGCISRSFPPRKPPPWTTLLKNLGAPLCSGHQQGHPAHQGQPSKYGWNGDPFVPFCGGMDRPNIKNLLLTGVVEALIGECQRAKNDQEDSKPSDRFHLLFLPGLDSAELGRDNRVESEGNLHSGLFLLLQLILDAAKKPVCTTQHTFSFRLCARCCWQSRYRSQRRQEMAKTYEYGRGANCLRVQIRPRSRRITTTNRARPTPPLGA